MKKLTKISLLMIVALIMMPALRVNAATAAIVVPTQVKKGDNVLNDIGKKISISPLEYFDYEGMLTSPLNAYNIGSDEPILEDGPYRLILTLGNITSDVNFTLNGKIITTKVDDITDFNETNESSYTLMWDILTLSVYYDADGNIVINGGANEEVTEDNLYDVKVTPSSFVKNTKDEVTFTVDAPYSLFTGVLVNGKKLDSKHYTSKEGSTIVVLNNAYLNSLEVGTYKVDFEFEEGSASSTFTVTKAVVKEHVPKTNDKVMMYISLFTASLILITNKKLIKE